MDKKKAIYLFSGVALAFVILMCFMYSISINNSDAELRNKYKAEYQICQTYYDKMWKIIQQQAQVSDKAADKFQEIYKPLMEGRYSANDQTMFKWIQEDNPEFSFDLYQKLMTTIEAERNEFNTEQSKLTSIWNEHENLLTKVPSSWFVKNMEHIQHQVVTSTKTDNVFKSKKDDDVDLYKK